MTNRRKIVVAMSGGVDSSVAAALLAEQGHEVIGLFMRLGNHGPADDSPSRRQGCCSAVDADDARFVAGALGIPFFALNFEAEFDRIIDYFADEYVNGRTPNPCVLCNEHLKFGRLVEYARAVGADAVATGHYARIDVHEGQARLRRGVDHDKDQSYVLFGIEREMLPRPMFPIGELTVDGVRRIAARAGRPDVAGDLLQRPQRAALGAPFSAAPSAGVQAHAHRRRLPRATSMAGDGPLVRRRRDRTRNLRRAEIRSGGR